MSSTPSSKLRILLADDDTDDSFLFNEALEQSEIPVDFTHAEDGNALIEMLHTTNKPDLLFLDVNMPYKNGIECLQEIRAKEEFQDMPIIIYSTTNYKMNIDACYEKGADLYVVKPSTFEDIMKMIRKVCSRDWFRKKKPSPEGFILSDFE
ncbi:response regulator [Aridibaculum aurantiacum]|uniref:response regulator n=1 Tax=Aridibaculum aurantiacum TaxID=2810307 RepID=UPI001A969F47|nr:response regulator [Aridibaculum aurantiacum]